MESYDHWADLPSEIACEIITRITDLRSLLNYMQISRTFYRLAHSCTRIIDSPVRIEVPLSYFAGFQNLQTIGDNISVTLNTEDLPLLSTLPLLTTANLRYSHTSGISGYPPLELGVILSFADGLKIAQKIHNLNLRLAIDQQTVIFYLIIQGNRFTIEPDPLRVEEVRQLFHLSYPQFEFVPIPGMMSLLSRGVRNFLSQQDFGLIDPSQPPSETNPPLVTLLREIAQSGLVHNLLITYAFLIYETYHQLGATGIPFADILWPILEPGIIHANDQLMWEYENERLGGREAELPDLIPLDNFDWRSLFRYMYRILKPARETFEQYDVPTPLPQERYDQIYQQVQAIYDLYNRPRPFRLYRTDGSFVDVTD